MNIDIISAKYLAPSLNSGALLTRLSMSLLLKWNKLAVPKEKTGQRIKEEDEKGGEPLTFVLMADLAASESWL